LQPKTFTYENHKIIAFFEQEKMSIKRVKNKQKKTKKKNQNIHANKHRNTSNWPSLNKINE
jgi:23S rRNA maturation mini-RNase III